MTVTLTQTRIDAQARLVLIYRCGCLIVTAFGVYMGVELGRLAWALGEHIRRVFLSF